MPLCTRNKNSKILFYADFMLRLCYYASERNVWISRLWVESSIWNKRISTLYRCPFVPETKTRKSNFMLILSPVYATRAIWKVRSMVFFLSNRLTNPFMFGINLNSYLSSMSGHKYHDNIVMHVRNILPWIHVLFGYWKKQNVNEIYNFLPFEKCARH